MNIGNILREFRQRVDREVKSGSNVKEFDAGEDGLFSFTPAIKDKVIESVTATIAYIMSNIVARHPPRSRGGTESGTQRITGSRFEL